MTINTEGRFDPDTKEIILDAMMADAKERFGPDINDGEKAVIRTLYDPVAERLAEAQIDLRDILDASQIANASGAALDHICEKIGVIRKPATTAKGTSRFSRSTAASTDYVIEKGVIIQTDGIDPIQFQTTKQATLPAGQTSVDVTIVAVNGGSNSNLGPNTLTDLQSFPTGIEEVTNPTETSGGSDVEADDELRERATEELGSGSRASANAILRALKRVEGVKSVSIFINDDDEPDDDGRDPHSFELVVEGGNEQDVANQIIDHKAAGDGTLGGFNGTGVTADAELINGQTHPVSWSEPTTIQVYVDATIQTTEDYAGDDAVRNAIVWYVGGLLTTGNEASGSLNGGSDVLFGEIEFAIRSVEGVYDVTDLKIGTSPNPTGTSNITISPQEVATSDGTDSSLTITKSSI
jgi:uncharacterized phage protein gp47/JayE